MYNHNDFEEDNEIQEKPKKKKFNIFDWYFQRSKEKDEKKVDAMKHPTIINYFVLLWRRLGKLCTANILFIFTNFPIIFLLIAASGFFGQRTVAPQKQQWGLFNGALLFDNNQITSSYAADYSTKTTITTISTTTLVFLILGILIIFTWGFAKVGTTYIYRNIMLGEPVFPFNDFIYIIKRNIKQSLIVGIIDALLIAMFAYNMYYLLNNFSVTGNALMLCLTVIMAILYSFMRPYLYIMIFTFDLPLRKIIKNAVYFVLLGVKRNLVAFFGSILVIILNLGLFFIFMPIGIILPFIITFAIIDFMGVYAAYPNIDKYMVDHSVSSESDELQNDESAS